MNHKHEQVLCGQCGIVILQCRCSAPNKATRFATCKTCNAKNISKQIKPEPPEAA